jgi:PEP-CTERM motif
MKAFVVCLLLSVAIAPGATLTHDYNLTSSLNDLVGISPLLSDGGSVGPTGYTFGANQGLNISSALSNVSNYSLLMDFSFTDLTSYRKIVDFQNLASDAGFYDLSQLLNFYPITNSIATVFDPNVQVRVVLTRDSITNTVNGYVNGVLGITFTDSSSIATFSGTNGIIRFFEDDNPTGQREASGGLATRISIYDGALTGSEVSALGTPSGPTTGTPEPSTLLLLAAGFGVLGLAARSGRIS